VLVQFRYEGPFTLSRSSVDRVVSSAWPGVYLLGASSQSKGVFDVRFVGRSDTNLADRLLDWVGSYPDFIFRHEESPIGALIEECRLFHTFDPTDNEEHPLGPAYTQATCHMCGIWLGGI
jgi:hypothetical protein